MLLLTRKYGESVNIGSRIVITIVELRSQSVKLGFEAPPDVPIWRSELWEAGRKPKGDLNDKRRQKRR